MDFVRRLSGLQEAMRENDTDLVVYGTCQNYQYLTGFPVDWRAAPDMRPSGHNVFIPREGAPIATGPWTNQAIQDARSPEPNQSCESLVQAILLDLKLNPKKVGLGRHLHSDATLAVVNACRGAEFCDASRYLDRTRMIKEPEEIDRLRRVAKLTDDVLLKVIDGIGTGSTQRGIMLEIEATARQMGATHMSFAPFSGFMKCGAGAPQDITNVPPDQGLEPDTAICFDVGFVLDGYASDWGRSVFWGKPQQFVVDAHRALRESMDEVVGALHDGSMRACDIYPAIEKALDKRGYGDQMRLRLADHRGMGHSIGVEVHEHPWLGYTCEETLRENMVIAIEPKLWHPGEYYLRQEEIVLIRRTDAEYLTNFDRELFVL